MNTSNRRKRKILTIEEKRKIIEEVKRGDVKKKEIACSSLSTIIGMEKEIMEDTTFPQQKRRKLAAHPDLDQCVKTWFDDCRKRGVPLDGEMLKGKAGQFAESLGYEFKGSSGWLTNFKKRNGLLFRKLCGESASVDDAVCQEWCDKLEEIVADFEPSNIFNVDETGLFFKCLPDRTFTTVHDDCHDGKRSKERITVLLGANLDGSEKLKPLLIGKSLKPRCFHGIKSFPLDYQANKKAWMTGDIFTSWLKNLGFATEII